MGFLICRQCYAKIMPKAGKSEYFEGICNECENARLAHLAKISEERNLDDSLR